MAIRDSRDTPIYYIMIRRGLIVQEDIATLSTFASKTPHGADTVMTREEGDPRKQGVTYRGGDYTDEF
jgi:hypothetical protein